MQVANNFMELERRITDLILDYMLGLVAGDPFERGERTSPRLPLFWPRLPAKIREKLLRRFIPSNFAEMPSSIQIACEAALCDMATGYAKRNKFWSEYESKRETMITLGGVAVEWSVN